MSADEVLGSQPGMEYEGPDDVPILNVTGELAGEVIELRLPAMAEQIPLIRMLTHGVVARADFGLDAIADAKMAVDEACAQLVQLADLGARLHCRFQPIAGGLCVSVSTTTTEPDPPSERTFGWHVLATLARSVSSHHDALPGETAGVTTIELLLVPGTEAG